jgi:hypothetical protein
MEKRFDSLSFVMDAQQLIQAFCFCWLFLGSVMLQFECWNKDCKFGEVRRLFLFFLFFFFLSFLDSFRHDANFAFALEISLC